ncbi:Ribonuclease II family protein [Schizosaccharomyces pombe]
MDLKPNIRRKEKRNLLKGEAALEKKGSIDRKTKNKAFSSTTHDPHQNDDSNIPGLGSGLLERIKDIVQRPTDTQLKGQDSNHKKASLTETKTEKAKVKPKAKKKNSKEKISKSSKHDEHKTDVHKESVSKLSKNLESRNNRDENSAKREKNNSHQVEADTNNATEMVSSNAKKSVYPLYYDSATVKKGLKSGTLFKGTLRILENHRSAFACMEDIPDFYVDGPIARNRAFHNDVVIVEPVMNNDSPTEKSNFLQNGVEKVKIKDHDDELGGAMEHLERLEIKSVASFKGDSRTRARVVAIEKRAEISKIVGILRAPGWSLKNVEYVSKKSSYAIFIPKDKRLPFITIHKNDLSDLSGENWIENILKHHDQLFSVEITRWSIYSRYPMGVLGEKLGNITDVEAYTNALLLENGISSSPFSDEVLNCLPPDDWIISHEEIKKRRDLRNELIITIDPETARDLDDAVSCRALGNGTYEVGVHIADVTHFVKPDSALDKEAASRATTVYLVQKAIPMLPPLLCERLCSLNPNVERLAFSVFWKLDSNGKEIGKRWFGKTVIKTCARLAYSEAQGVIEGKSWDDAVGKPIGGTHTPKDVETSILTLCEISRKLRKDRFAKGAVEINSTELKFQLDEYGMPNKCEVYEQTDANHLIEEFMLLANRSVAEHISKNFPNNSLLRRHANPKEKQINEFCHFLKSMNFDFDASSSAAFNASMVRLRSTFNEELVELFENMAVRSLNRAEYFCTGDFGEKTDWHHYALSFNHYTHFTSPIRRYPDIIVHRLLERSLKNTSPGIDKKNCSLVAAHCNEKKEKSTTVQEDSQQLFLSVYIAEYCKKHDKKSMPVQAFATRISGNSIDVYISEYGISNRVDLSSDDRIKSFIVAPDDSSVKITLFDDSQKTIALTDRFQVYLYSDYSRTFFSIRCSLVSLN